VSREWKAENTVVRLAGGVSVGGPEVVTIAGPCSVENERQIIDAARLGRRRGVILRGGAWKPRTSPYAFQGLAGRAQAARQGARGNGPPHLHRGDGSRGCRVRGRGRGHHPDRRPQHAELLAAQSGGPGEESRAPEARMAATIEELLLSAEYVLAEGNHDVILCERGIRGFDTATRNVFDLTAIPVVHKLSHLPIIADPSHGTGLRDKVIPMARAAVAAGRTASWSKCTPTPSRRCRTGADAVS